MGLLDGYPGLGAGGNIDLNQLVRPPDPLGAALGEISQRLAVAGQASRLPVSTLGAIGSALGGASTAAQTQQTQYLDQAIKLQALKRSLQQMGFDQTQMDFLMKKWALQQGGGGATPAPASAVPGVLPGAAPVAPAAAPGAPAAIPGRPAATPAATPSPDYGASGDFPTGLGYNTAPGGPIINSGLLSPDTVGGAGAAISPNLFRLASLVAPAGDESGSGVGSGTADPLGLIAKYESGGRNIRQQVVPESVSSASGPWQMLDSTFHETAKKHGIDTSQYKSAQDAPIETQRAVAQALYDEKGFAPWANYNPKLAAAIGGGTPTGGTASPVSTLRGLLAGSDDGGNDPLSGLLALATGGGAGGGGEDPLAGLLKPQDEVIPSGGGLPAGMLRNAALGAGNAGYPIPNILPPGGNAAFPALPPNTTGNGEGDVVLPSGAPLVPIRNDIPPSARQNAELPRMQLAQYAPGGGPAAAGAPAVAAGAPIQGAFPPLVGPGSGTIPGLGMTPQEVAILNAMSSLAGHANPPLKEFLDLYYKSPQYLRESAQATQQGQTAVTGPAQILLDQAKAQNDINVGMAKDHVMIDPYGSGKVVPIPGYAEAAAWDKNEIEKVTNKWQTKLEETRAKFDTITVPILQKDNTIADTPMSRYDRDQKQQMQGNRAPQPGDIVGKPTTPLSPDLEWRRSPDGTFTAQPVANTPAAQKAADLARTQAVADRQLQVSRDVVVNSADRIENLVKTYPNTTTGIVGSKLTGVWQPSADVQALIETIEARSSLDQLQALRAGSPTGASGLGGASDVEGRKLQTSIANLKQSQSQPQFLENLAIVKQDYINAVHGPGAYKQMSDEGVLKVPTAPPASNAPYRYNRQTGQMEPK